MIDAASDPFAAAQANIRETVKWLVTAFAAMTAAVVGTSPLTGLGSLPFGERLYLAVGAGFIGLLIAAWVIAKALRLLVTPPFFLGDIVADAALREFVDTHAYDLMPSQYPTVAQVVAARKDALDILRGMVAGNADDARVTLRKLSPWTDRLMSIGYLEHLRRRLDGSLWSMAVAAFAAVLFFGIFAWAANPPKAGDPTRDCATLLL
jgi:hypothetical protein